MTRGWITVFLESNYGYNVYKWRNVSSKCDMSPKKKNKKKTPKLLLIHIAEKKYNLPQWYV